MFGIALSYNIGITYDDLGEYDKALYYYLKSVKLERKMGNLTSREITMMHVNAMSGVLICWLDGEVSAEIKRSKS